MESSLTSETTHLFVVYYNPVFANLLDTSPAFTRWYAETFPYESSEVGYGPDEDDTVIVWQSLRGARPTPHERVDREVITVIPTLRVKLAS
jgi:hypothetical protein